MERGQIVSQSGSMSGGHAAGTKLKTDAALLGGCPKTLWGSSQKATWLYRVTRAQRRSKQPRTRLQPAWYGATVVLDVGQPSVLLIPKRTVGRRAEMREPGKQELLVTGQGNALAGRLKSPRADQTKQNATAPKGCRGGQAPECTFL